jgi:hypothetical protein
MCLNTHGSCRTLSLTTSMVVVLFGTERYPAGTFARKKLEGANRYVKSLGKRDA